MADLFEFTPGQIYKRTSIHDRLGGQRQGGISTPSEAPVILIFTGESGTTYGYHDGFQENGTFWYTGEGQIGDMTFVRGNRAIRDHKQDGKSLHIFEQAHRAHVSYIGHAEYLGYHESIAPDRELNNRIVIVFELGLVLPDQRAEPKESTDFNDPAPLTGLSIKQLRETALRAGLNAPNKTQTIASVYRRSQAIKLYVLKRAAGICESCFQPAPFKTPKGEPYLEPHHITRLADGGPDHPKWVAAICPNCHRRIHHGEDGEKFNRELADYLEKIEKC